MDSELISQLITAIEALGRPSRFTVLLNILSFLVILATLWFNYKSIKLNKETLRLNQNIHQDHIYREERRFLPIFEVNQKISIFTENYATIQLINKSEQDFIYNSSGTSAPTDIYASNKNGDKLDFTIYDDFITKDYIKLWIYYTTINHRQAATHLVLRFIDDTVRIETIQTQYLN
jgi:hypothetical protein